MHAASGFGLLALFSLLSSLLGEDRRHRFNSFDATLATPRWTP